MKYALPVEPAAPPTRPQIARLVDALERMPAFLRRALDGRGDTRSRTRPGPEPDAFSLHEHAWHLRDLEVVGYSARLRRLATEEQPLLPDVDGTALAVERDYLALPLAEALADFERERAANVARLRALPLAAFERHGELEGVGCITLAQLLERWCDHDAAHRREISALAT